MPYEISEIDEYYMGIAFAVRRRGNCLGRRVGAVIVKENRVVSTGYNGVAMGLKNCTEGGCLRCRNPNGQFPSGAAYDLCICVHAEQNAILTAARFGISVEGSKLYSTDQPCFNCAKEIKQVGIEHVFYVHPWHVSDSKDGLIEEKKAEYQRVIEAIGDVKQLDIEDRDAGWAHERYPFHESQPGISCGAPLDAPPAHVSETPTSVGDN